MSYPVFSILLWKVYQAVTLAIIDVGIITFSEVVKVDIIEQ